MDSPNNDKPVMVSIRCLVYNHEPYLRDALEGIVMQQTDFHFEAIVHDDCSTDNSAAIIREYAEKYPDIIKPIYETENQWSKRDGTLDRILIAAIPPSAKYLAWCEGDDYWTDPHKLQRQVDFLEAHPDYSMCFHGVIEHWHDGSRPDRPLNPDVEEREYTGPELWAKHFSQTASLVIRREVFSSPKYVNMLKRGKVKAGDWAMIVACAEFGKVHCIPDMMSVYRRNPGSLSFKGGEEIRLIIDKMEIVKAFGNKYKPHVVETAMPILARDFFHHLRRGKLKKAWHIFTLSFGFAPLDSAKYFYKHFVSYKNHLKISTIFFS